MIGENATFKMAARREIVTKKKSTDWKISPSTYHATLLNLNSEYRFKICIVVPSLSIRPAISWGKRWYSLGIISSILLVGYVGDSKVDVGDTELQVEVCGESTDNSRPNLSLNYVSQSWQTIRVGHGL